MGVPRASFVVLAMGFCLAAFPGFAPACHAADVVVMNDGKTIEGEIVTETDAAVVMKTAAGPEMVNKKDVREVRREKKAAASGGEAHTFKPDTIALIEKAEKAAGQENIEDSYKYYQKLSKLDDSIALHRRMAHVFLDVADRIKNRYWAEFEASTVAWEAARKGAYKDVRYMVGNTDAPGQVTRGKKFDPDNPAYKAATDKHNDLLQKISQCFPFYEKAQLAFGAVLRLAPTGKDFDAAGHLPLCLTIKGELNTHMRGRQMIMDFLDAYKPNTVAEEALYKRCQNELERVTKNCK